MKKYIFPSILFLFFAPLLRGQEIDFKKTMDRLKDNVQETTYEGVEDGWYGVMDIPDLLFLTIIQDKDLYYIFYHPAKYKKQLLTYINDDSVKWEYKYFALGLLQGLCIQEYLPIIENIYALFEREIISAPVDLSKPIRKNNFHPSLDVLKLSIDQGNLSWEVCKNYNNMLVKKLLNQIISNEKVSTENKKYCTEVLSGNTYRQKKMLLRKHLITIPIFECKNRKAFFHTRSFYIE